ncbi:MAG: 50S ribosomal protein L30 [Pseudomonadota bacterium]
MTKRKAEEKKEKKVITVTQKSSPIGRDKSQRQVLIGLGLNKIGRMRQLTETPSILGMVNKVKHLLKVEN